MKGSGKKYHTILAEYFSRELLYLDEPVCRKPHIRKCMEQPWQQTKAELWDEVTDTLCNLDFIQAKAAAKKTYELVNDFNEVLEVIPDNAENIRKEKARQERMDKYIRDLIACAKGEITLDELDIPESITPWKQGIIDNEIERMKTHPSRVDLLNEFMNFIGVETDHLQNYAFEIPNFTHQQAWNYAEDGPVGRLAGQIESEKQGRLTLCPQPVRPSRNPFPAVLKIFSGPVSAGMAMDIALGGERIISASSDNTCLLRETKSGRIIRKLKHSCLIRTLCISPDGRFALTGTDQNSCILWDVESEKILKKLEGHTQFVQAISMTPDGKLALSGSNDRTCILWDLDGGKILKRLDGHSMLVSSVCISPNGKFGLSGSWDKKCILWNLETGLALKTLADPKGMVTSLGMTPDCSQAVVGYSHHISIIWNLNTGQVSSTFTGHSAWVGSVGMTPDGKLAVSGSTGKSCMVWETKTGNLLKTLKGPVADNQSVRITPDGTRVISLSGGDIVLWNSMNGQWLKKEEEGVGSEIREEGILTDRKRAITARSGFNCILWNLDTGRIDKILTGHKASALLARVVPCSNKAITCSNDQVSILWNTETGTALKTLTSGEGYDTNEIAVTPDGNRAIVTSLNALYFWNLKSGNSTKITSEIHSEKLKLTPCGKMAVYSNRLLDLSSGKWADFYYEYITWPVAITPDGKCIFSGAYYDDLTWFDLETGSERSDLEVHLNRFDALIMTPDGRYALTGEQGKSCSLWDARTGQMLKKVEGFSGYATTIQITPDGKHAVLLLKDSPDSNGNSLVIWDFTTGKILSRFTGKFEIERCVLFPWGIAGSNQSRGTVILHVDREWLSPGPSVVTARCLWDFEKNRWQDLTADCPVCGSRFSPHAGIEQTIGGILENCRITNDASPCLSLPDEAWDDSGLLSNCPSCGERLKLNPFIAGGDFKPKPKWMFWKK